MLQRRTKHLTAPHTKYLLSIFLRWCTAGAVEYSVAKLQNCTSLKQGYPSNIIIDYEAYIFIYSINSDLSCANIINIFTQITSHIIVILLVPGG